MRWPSRSRERHRWSRRTREATSRKTRAPRAARAYTRKPPTTSRIGWSVKSSLVTTPSRRRLATPRKVGVSSSLATITSPHATSGPRGVAGEPEPSDQEADPTAEVSHRRRGGRSAGASPAPGRVNVQTPPGPATRVGSTSTSEPRGRPSGRATWRAGGDGLLAGLGDGRRRAIARDAVISALKSPAPRRSRVFGEDREAAASRRECAAAHPSSLPQWWPRVQPETRYIGRDNVAKRLNALAGSPGGRALSGGERPLRARRGTC